LKQLKEHATAADYAGEIKPSPDAMESGLAESDDPRELASAWTLETSNGQTICVGDWNADDKQDILVAGSDGTLQIVDLEGKVTARVTLPAPFKRIELGRHPSGPRLLGYSGWGDQVTVVDTAGKTVWTYPAADGVNGAHWGDLDGDGADEMIVGMNGSGGLHAVSPDGTLLWKVSDIGNVWNQAAIPARNKAEARVVCTEAGGTIQVFDARGKRLNILRPLDKYFSQMAAVRESDAGPIQIIATGAVTVAVDDTGDLAWSTPAKEDNGRWRAATFAWGDLDGDGSSEWAFVDITGDLVLVTPQGEKFAALPGSQKFSGFAIVTGSDDGLLITLNAGVLSAYRCE
jgi:hypothetical protein